MENKHYLKDDKLKAAFRLFDIKNDGFITANEVKEVLGQDDYYKNKSDTFWDDLIKEADTNNDGLVDFEEFKNMMKDKS